MMNLTRVLAAKGTLIGVTALAIAGASTTPASADEVGGCAQGGTQYPGTCISVTTGPKDGANHTQLVNKITINAPRGASASTMEAWAGNGPSGIAWYQSGNGTHFEWTIDKWIKTDSGICGAYTWPGSGRSIACITIKA